MVLITCRRLYHSPAACEVDWPNVFRQLLRSSAFEPGLRRRMNVFPNPMDSLKVLLSGKFGWLQARTDLPGRLRVGAARRFKASTASVFVGVVLALTSCAAARACLPAVQPARPDRRQPPHPVPGDPRRAVPRRLRRALSPVRCRSRRTLWWSSWRTTPTPRSSATLPRRSSTARRPRRAVHPLATPITHPSQPNYLALFSGGTQGVTDDSCPDLHRAEPGRRTDRQRA